MPRPSVTTARSSLSGRGSKLSASISPISPRILPIHCSYSGAPVLEVEAGPLQEVGDPGLDLGRVGDPDRGQVGVAVEHPEVDPEGRRDQVVAGVVLRQRGQGELVEGGVPGAHDLRPVDPVLEPEHRVLVLAPVGRERQRVGVQLLPPLGPRGGLDLEGAGEPVRHGPVLSVEARVTARACPSFHVCAAATARVATMLAIGSAAAGHRLGRLAAPDRLRAGLEQGHGLVVGPVGVKGPLHVLGAAVVPLGPPGQPGHRLDLVVGEAGGGPAGLVDRDPLDPVAVAQPVLDRLVGDGALDDLAQHLVDQEAVRGDLAGHDALAEPPGGLDRDLGAVAVAGVEGEGHPRGGRADHLLDPDRHGDHVVVVAALAPVGDRPGREQARPAAGEVAQHLVGAADPQVGVVLAGEAGVGQVLGGGRGAHRHRDRVELRSARTARCRRRGRPRPRRRRGGPARCGGGWPRSAPPGPPGRPGRPRRAARSRPGGPRRGRGRCGRRRR